MTHETEAEFLNYLDSIKDNMDKDDLPTRFLYHYRTNPNVYRMFEAFALQAIQAGITRLSAWLIANRMRWEVELQKQVDEEFKISNDFIGLYARLFMARHPQYSGYFVTKRMPRIKE